jgi:two-component system, OmpR family, response regulator
MVRTYHSYVAPTGSPRVLVIEDDLAVRDSVEASLRGQGYEVRTEADGLRVEAVADEFQPDLALLDVGLPGGPSGLSIARMLRQTSDIPILFLTAAGDVEDRIAGFDAGGDDYLVKPFALSELHARLKALLRRAGRLTSTTRQIGNLTIDEETRTVTRDGTKLDLTRTEFDLLAVLTAKPGRVLSKTQLLTSVWGFDAYDQNLVEVYVSSLRRKLEAGDRPRVVHTIRGVGYVLRA